MTLNLWLFLFYKKFERREVVIIRYKKNRRIACYDNENLITTEKKTESERFCGPFESCGKCPYPSHGFLCYRSEGDCLRTDVEKMNKKKKINYTTQI